MFRLLLLLAVAFLSLTRLTAGADLSPKQQERAQGLYTKFLAPCCWRQPVAQHRSAEAEHVRREIDNSIAAGKSDSEIKAMLIHEYGHGILIEPEGIRAFFAYVIPCLAILGGLYGCVVWIRRHRVPAQA